VTFEQKALSAGKTISKGVGTTARKIDLLLAGKRYTRKANKSSVDISQSFSWTEGGVYKPSTDFGVNLRLPNLERRWQLRFTSYDEDQEERDLQQKRLHLRPRERDYGAGILFFEKLGRIKTTFQPRLELKDPLQMKYVLRFESDADVKPVHLIPRFELFADPNKGTGEFASLEFNVALTDRLGLALRNTEEYRARENFFTTQHEISLERSLTDTQAVGAAVSCVSTNRPSFHLDNLTASTTYGRQIYPDRLRWSLSPFLSFSKGFAFKGKAGVGTVLGLTF
jgi:hypothetical protein